MKIKKVAAICNADGHYYLMDQKDRDGDVIGQWLGDGKSAYPLVGLPNMNLENVCTMFDITEKKQEKLIMKRVDVPGNMNWDDTDGMERQLRDPKLCLHYAGTDLLPLETSRGVVFIQEKYLAPLDSNEYMRLYERQSTSGGLFIVAKVGFMIQEVILPMDNMPDNEFMDTLDDLVRQCRDAQRHRAVFGQMRESMEPEKGQETLFDVDQSTGEVINFPGAAEGGGEDG